jgi:hypothetical protein
LVAGILALCLVVVGLTYLIPQRFDAMLPRDQVASIAVTQMRITPGVEGGSVLSSDTFTEEAEIQAIYDVLYDSRFTKKFFQPNSVPSYSTPVDSIELQFVKKTSSGSDAQSVFIFTIFSDDQTTTYPRPDYDGAVQISKQWGTDESAWYNIAGGARRRVELYQSLKAAIDSFA